MPTAPRVARHVTTWVVLYGFWLVVTRANQPTWPVAVVATLLLVSTAAVAVYADWYVLRPRFAGRWRWVAYFTGLLVVVAGLSFATVPLIQAVYDVAEVPRERRFGFWTNIGYESVWYVVHLGAAAVVRTGIRLRHGERRPDEPVP